jgi:hypothetical protein
MKFYITAENISKIKHSFLNLKLFSIIYIPEILEQYGYTYDTIDDYGAFIVSKYINDLIKTYAKSKRIRGIFYLNPKIDNTIIPNLFETINEIDNITDVILLDDRDVPKLKHLYDQFDEVFFFPTIRKIRLIECKPLHDNTKWKSNNKALEN